MLEINIKSIIAKLSTGCLNVKKTSKNRKAKKTNIPTIVLITSR